MSDPFPSSQDLQPVEVKSNIEIAPRSYCLRYQRQHDFIPGQVVAIALDCQTAPRLYSICSAPHEDMIEILFNIKSDGLLSPWLAKRQSGDMIYTSIPFGTFRAPPTPACWIATGTGVAPFRSMLRDGQPPPMRFIQGARHLHQFYFTDEWKVIPDYVRCCSAEQDNGIYPGRLTQWLQETPDLDPTQQYALCGSAEMVVAVRDILISRGINIDQITSEIYF